MNKRLITSLLIICQLYFSCSKINESEITPARVDTSLVKLTLVSGTGQADTIGNSLPNRIIVKVTKNGVPTNGYTVQFVASGCNQTDTISTPSQPDGTAVYDWSLSGEVGQQSMTAYVLNSNSQKVDSVKATATALATGSGWHHSACSVQVSSSPNAFCKLSTGRLFTCFGGGKTYLRYSDDNGVSWYAVKSLGNTHVISEVLSTPDDKIFALTQGSDGIYYSNNAGTNWSRLGISFNTGLFGSIVYTASKKLIATSGVNPPFSISADLGKTWTGTPFSAFIPQNMNNPIFVDPTEDRDGNLYIVERQNGNLFKSKDLGKTWTMVPETGYNFPGDVFAFYIDNNNWFYKSTQQFSPGIYLSKDNGITYNLIVHYSPIDEIANMSFQSDGNFYYENMGSGLYSYDGNLSKLVFGYREAILQPYIIAKNNNIIIANTGQLHILYYSK